MKKKPTPKIQVVAASAVAELQRQICEWERFAGHLLVTLGTGKEPISLQFKDDTMSFVMRQLRRYYPQMGITEMVKDVESKKHLSK